MIVNKDKNEAGEQPRQCLFCGEGFNSKPQQEDLFCADCTELRNDRDFYRASIRTLVKTIRLKTGRLSFHQQSGLTQPEFKKALNGYLQIARSQQFVAFCRAALWNNMSFDKDLQEECLIQSLALFSASEDPDQLFEQLIERAVLGKTLEEQKYGAFISPPNYWFDTDNTDGLAGTVQAYNKLQEQRGQIPQYKFGIKLLAEAVVKHFDSGNLFDLARYFQQFIQLGEASLLQIYLALVVGDYFANTHLKTGDTN